LTILIAIYNTVEGKEEGMFTFKKNVARFPPEKLFTLYALGKQVRQHITS
jgi:hypothetical protein